jgi:OmcA/MtrC family decaheme c-type cytochrome
VLDPIAFGQNVSFAVSGADLLVSFSLVVDGAPGVGYDTVERGYQTDGVTRTDICNAPSRNDPCLATSLTVAAGAIAGDYTVTVIGGATAANDNRYMFRVSDGGLRSTRVYFYGDYGVAPVGPPAVSAAACTNCHGPEGIGIHGGYYAAEDGVEPCLVCHGVDVPSLAEVAHGFHSSIWVEDPAEGPIHITYPTYMNNCSVCHAEPAELTAANSMPVSAGCFTCHGTMESWRDYFQPDPDATPPLPDRTIHFSLTPTPETADCTSCHSATGIAANKLVVTDSHNGLTTERGGIIWDGEDTSVTEGALFDWQITGVEVVDAGANLAISWIASYDGVGVNPCNETLGAGAPTFHAATDGSGSGNLSMLRNYAQGDDFILGMSTSSPGQALSVNVTVDNTVCASNIATTTIPADVVTAERGIVALQGKPRTVSPDGSTTGQRVRAKTPTYEFMVADGSAPVALRRDIVDTDQCLKCHVGSLYQHGGNRVDNVGMCILCHNSASNEKNVRTATMGIDPADTYDGRTGQTFEMKTMLHRIHSAGVTGQPPYVIYRGRGIYAFAPEGTVLPNWPGTGVQEVFGSTIDNDGNPGTYSIAHNFHSPTYPRSLNECAACHVATLPVQPDQTKAMASTQDAGGSVWDDQTDDVLQGAATTACITCHAAGPAKGHAYQNSWQPQEFENGRQTIIDAVN